MLTYLVDANIDMKFVQWTYHLTRAPAVLSGIDGTAVRPLFIFFGPSETFFVDLGLKQESQRKN